MTIRSAGESSVVLILDDDRERATHAAGALTGPGRLVLTGGDAVVGALVGRRLAVASLMTEAQIAGPFTFDGLDAVSAVRRAAPSCRIVVTGEHMPEDVAAEAVRRGASGILLRPFGASELRTRFGLEDAAGDDGVILHIPTVDEFVASDALLPAFQPIVDLADASRPGVGFESLARYRAENMVFCDPAFMFEYARLCGRTVDLDLACLRRTLRAARQLPSRGKIEGVESEATSRAAADIGARYAQGFFYARPADAGALPG